MSSAAANGGTNLLHRGEIVADDDNIAVYIDGVIGEGRCSVVYAGHDVTSGRSVAVKAFRPGSAFDGARQRELLVLNRSSAHRPNIVSCLGSVCQRSLHCLVLERLDLNLRQVIFRSGRRGLQPGLLQAFARDVLNALRSLHDEALVHADLKPANVMWSAAHECFKLVDFSLAFFTTEKYIHRIQTKGYQAPEASLWNAFREETNPKSCRLRPPSTAPSDGPTTSAEWPSQSSGIFTASEDTTSTSSEENVADPRHGHGQSRGWPRSRPRMPDSAADMWSFGCLLFEALTGSKLFPPGDRLSSVLTPRQQLAMRIGLAEARYEDAGAADVFSAVTDLLDKCLAEEPEDRITAEDAMAHDFVTRHLHMTTLPTGLSEDHMGQDDLDCIKEEAGKFGIVKQCSLMKENVLVEFDEELWLIYDVP